MKALIIQFCFLMLLTSCVSIGMGGDLLEVRTLERTLSSGGTLRFRNTSGNLQLTEWGESHIEIEVSIYGDSSRGVPENLEISIMETEGELSCVVICPGGMNFTKVDLKVSVPSSMEYVIESETVNGTTDVTAGATASVATVNGNIRMDVTDADHVETVNGSIDLVLARQQNDLSVTTTNGHVSIWSPEYFAIEAGTTNGGVTVRGTGYGRHASIASPEGWLLEARTANGNIDIHQTP